MSPVFIFLLIDSVGRDLTTPSTAITYSSLKSLIIEWASGNSSGRVVTLEFNEHRNRNNQSSAKRFPGKNNKTKWKRNTKSALHTWTVPVWSLRLRKVRPPWTRWSATHPQRRTHLPTSSTDNSPQNPVRPTQWSVSSRGIVGLGVAMRVSVEEEEEGVDEAEETEKTVLFKGRGSAFGKKGLKRTLWNERRKGGLGRKDMSGKALKRKVIVMASVTEKSSGI